MTGSRMVGMVVSSTQYAFLMSPRRRGYRSMWPYRRGYSGRNYHVTGGHEREARAAQLAKEPNRLGILVLRLLGLHDAPKPVRPIRGASPSHEHRHKT
jgi:hypothetical protein